MSRPSSTSEPRTRESQRTLRQREGASTLFAWSMQASLGRETSALGKATEPEEASRFDLGHSSVRGYALKGLK